VTGFNQHGKKPHSDVTVRAGKQDVHGILTEF
jgi:hypothetical protein